MSAPRTFVDTNIFVYAYDSSAGAKREAAGRAIAELWRSGTGLISTQVLQELYVTLTRKIPRPLAPADAFEIIEDLTAWDIVVNDGGSVLEASRLERQAKLSFWDALIVVAAERGGAEILLSEDLSQGRTFGGIRVANPF
ncbi:MAG: PIN domain-containing protein [Candidatus Aminicenantes bacterium]|nr:PIN domain-containing protein [Candidatus Aminicenantes bacterium]